MLGSLNFSVLSVLFNLAYPKRPLNFVIIRLGNQTKTNEVAFDEMNKSAAASNALKFAFETATIFVFCLPERIRFAARTARFGRRRLWQSTGLSFSTASVRILREKKQNRGTDVPLSRLAYPKGFEPSAFRVGV